MTPVNPVLGGAEQVLLVVFTLMLLVGIAGGNPAMVFGEFARITAALMAFFFTAMFALLNAVVRLLFELVKTLLGAITQTPVSKRNRR